MQTALTLFVIGVLGIAMILVARNAARRRSKDIEQLRVKVTEAEGITWSTPVRYASARWFRSFWKSLPWEGHGLLCVRQSDLLFFGYSKARCEITLRVPRDEVCLQWIGRKLWPNFFISWFKLSANEQTHYLTSDTGTFVFGSKRTTDEILQKLSKMLAT